MTHFSLIPFPDNSPHPDIQIQGEIERVNQQLQITFNLTGELEKVAIASPVDVPTRLDELWQTTCFEFFLGLSGSSRYWEFNLSPAGHWNIYRFDNYRQGMTTETAYQALPFVVQHQSDCFGLILTLDLNPIITPEQELNVGITTVIESKNQTITYWALTHAAKEADFHQRASFTIHLA
ncbi:MAG: DOMON-like domain-containing protein [Snowella sp.]|nr:DOMON-like domain-containing protein [Snowella sp.]